MEQKLSCSLDDLIKKEGKTKPGGRGQRSPKRVKTEAQQNAAASSRQGPGTSRQNAAAYRPGAAASRGNRNRNRGRVNIARGPGEYFIVSDGSMHSIVLI